MQNIITLQQYNIKEILIQGPFDIKNKSEDQIQKTILKNQDSCWSSEENGFIVQFKFLKDLIQEIKQLSNKYNIVDIPSYILQLLKGFNKNNFQYKVFYQGKQNNSKHITYNYNTTHCQKTCQDLPDYIYSRLFNFQKVCIDRAIQEFNGRLLIADDMGTGKTIQSLCLSWLYKDLYPLLIVCPSSLKGNWQQECLNWLKEINITEIQTISKKNEWIIKNIKILIITYEMAQNYSDKLRELNFQIAIADEAHYLKNSQAKRSQAMIPILQGVKHPILLTGTPAMNKPKELYSIVNIIRPDIFNNFKIYGERYCDPKPSDWGNTIDYEGCSNEQELNFILRQYFMIRRTKDEVLSELPTKFRKVERISPDLKISEEIKNLLNFTNGQQQNSKNISKLFEEVLQNQENPNNSKKNSSSFNQKFENNLNFTKSYLLTGKAKIKESIKFIQNLLPKKEKVIIFAHHNEVIQELEIFLKKQSNFFNFVKITGNVSTQDRDINVDLFQNDPYYKVALLSIKASSCGITLNKATDVIFVELTWNPSLIMQAEDRAHRIGQQNQITCHYLLCDGTLDDIMYSSINKKLDNINNIMNSNLSKDAIMGNSNINNRDTSIINKKSNILKSDIAMDQNNFIGNLDTTQKNKNKSQINQQQVQQSNKITNYFTNCRQNPQDKYISPTQIPKQQQSNLNNFLVDKKDLKKKSTINNKINIQQRQSSKLSKLGISFDSDSSDGDFKIQQILQENLKNKQQQQQNQSVECTSIQNQNNYLQENQNQQSQEILDINDFSYQKQPKLQKNKQNNVLQKLKQNKNQQDNNNFIDNNNGNFKFQQNYNINQDQQDFNICNKSLRQQIEELKQNKQNNINNENINQKLSLIDKIKAMNINNNNKNQFNNLQDNQVNPFKNNIHKDQQNILNVVNQQNQQQYQQNLQQIDEFGQEQEYDYYQDQNFSLPDYQIQKNKQSEEQQQCLNFNKKNQVQNQPKVSYQNSLDDNINIVFQDIDQSNIQFLQMAQQKLQENSNQHQYQLQQNEIQQNQNQYPKQQSQCIQQQQHKQDLKKKSKTKEELLNQMENSYFSKANKIPKHSKVLQKQQAFKNFQNKRLSQINQQKNDNHGLKKKIFRYKKQFKNNF